MSKRTFYTLATTSLVGMTLLAACNNQSNSTEEPVSNDNQSAETTDTYHLAILGTTDIHSHVLPYDYMNNDVDETIGLSKVYTLVEEARSEFDHSILVDNGDVIQGSILGDTQVEINPVADDETHVVMEAMNEMGYVSGTYGNHEFNFGLDYLEETVSYTNFPWLSANVVEPGTEDPVFEPYTIIEEDIDGQALNIGIIGFVPPAIMGWDSQHLEGEVETIEIVDAAEKYIPEMKENGADIIIVTAHTGIDDGDEQSENAAIPLSAVEGIDAMILGHNHGEFPVEGEYEDMDGVDVQNGTINDVPAVMPGSWGSHLGVIDLELRYENDEWTVESATSEIRSSEEAASNETIEALAQSVHEETVDYVNSPVGEIAADAHTYFARVEDSEVVQLINNAQLDFTEQLKADGELPEDLPILSAGAPFRAGRDGEYTFIEQGEISIGDMNDVYVYPNTLAVVEVNGDQLKNWLEFSAKNFNTIDPSNSDDQYLINDEERSYNFDIIENITYSFDVTQEEGNRVQNIMFEGEPVQSEDRFYVATNNHRISGDDLDEDVKIILETTTENRQIIMDYVINHDGVLDLEPSHNWNILPIEAAGNVLFNSAPEAVDYYQDFENVELYEEGSEQTTFIYS